MNYFIIRFLDYDLHWISPFLNRRVSVINIKYIYKNSRALSFGIAPSLKSGFVVVN